MDLLDRMLGHDAWTTRHLLDHCRALPDEDWTKPFDIGPGSLQATFVHLVGAMGRWADSIAGRAREFSVPEQASPDLLLELLSEASGALADACREVQGAARLDEMMDFVTQDGETYTFTRGSAIVHVITHGMHHRAQVFNMLRRLDAMPRIDGDAIEWELMARVADA